MTNRGKILAVLLLFLTQYTLSQGILSETRRVEVSYTIDTLKGLNSSYAEFSPIFYNNAMIITSDREFDLVNYGESRWKKHALLNLFKVDFKVFNNDSIVYEEPELFEPKFRSSSHTGPIAIHPNGKVAVFTQVNYKTDTKKKVKKHKPKLYVSEYENGKWSKPEVLPFIDAEFAFGHPSFDESGNTLIFSSDQKDGFGGDDLYVVSFTNGEWGSPKNLGSKINSKNDEVFPHLYNGKLYFASDRSGGLGGLDIYVSELVQEETFSEPKNVGEPLNSRKDDFGIYFRSDNQGYFSSNRDGGEGADDIYRYNVIEKLIVESDFVAGKFQYRNLDGSGANGLDVMLLDEDGNLVYKTQTNEEGEFLFRNLGAEGSYLIRIEGEEELDLIIYNENGEKVAYLRSNDKGEFVYKRLKADDVGTLALIDEESIEDGFGSLNGQFIYESLPGKYASQLNVLLIDEDGNIVYRTQTDEHGNFSFENLPADQNYIVRMEELNDDLTLVIYNNNDNVTAILRMDGQGDFVFRRLDQKFASDLAMLEMEDEDLLSELEESVFGRFEHRRLKTDFGDGLEFEVLDSLGDIVYASVTDRDGFFRLAGLPMTESYIFRIAEEDSEYLGEVKLTILNRNGKKVALLDRDKEGYFVYTPLGLSGAIDLTTMNFEDQDLDALMKIPTIYYDSDSYRLDSKAKSVLQEVAKDMKANPKLLLEANSYADSRASEDYNLKLSEKRTNAVIKYMRSLGINDDRLGGNAYGESKLLNDCDNGVDCPEELHRLNRRSEIRIYKKKDISSILVE